MFPFALRCLLREWRCAMPPKKSRPNRSAIKGGIIQIHYPTPRILVYGTGLQLFYLALVQTVLLRAI